MKKRALFIGSTGQHVGKTTLCLGLFSLLKKTYGRVGFIKPVGQESVVSKEGDLADKDVPIFKEVFHLSSSYREMSPVLFLEGLTKDFLDKKISQSDLQTRIRQSFLAVLEKNDFVLVEGTGHLGVGSIGGLNNAQVAAMLGLSMILVAPGGIGSSFDQIALNKSLCDAHHVPLLGVILNRVLKEKKEKIALYMGKALADWQIPLLGTIPFDPLLSYPTMRDFELLFNVPLLSAQEYRLRHFKRIRLITNSRELAQEPLQPGHLILAPANREDILLEVLQQSLAKPVQEDLEIGLILTETSPLHSSFLDQFKNAHIPLLWTSSSTYTAIKKITAYTSQIGKDDQSKIQEAIHLVESNIDQSALHKLLSI